ncbi:MAG: tyrosine-type recombinase/integrase [Hyphomonadaceae bacterium]|nr:tyrosine-type recombinase/integrase [Hyphomonadaceae bacterium]
MPGKYVAGGEIVERRVKGKLYTYFVKDDVWHRLSCSRDDPELASEIRRVLASASSITTIDDLAVAFIQCRVWQNYRTSTRKRWRPWIDRIRDGLGSLRLKIFESEASADVIEKWRERFESSKRNMDYAKTVLSRLLSYGVERRLISGHHCGRLETFYHGDRSHITWTDSEIAKFLAEAPAHVGQVAALALLTGLRRGDLLALQWSQIREHHIEVWTQKSGKRTLVEIPLYDELRTFLFRSNRREGNVLVNSRGKPWTGDGFGTAWRKARLASGIEGKTFHDLRGTAATKLHEAGMALDDIVLLMGWSKRHAEKIISRYISRRNQYEHLKAKMQKGMGGQIIPFLDRS